MIKFQIKNTKEYLKREQSRILRFMDEHKNMIKLLESDLKFLDKCRTEINEANKLIREYKKLKELTRSPSNQKEQEK